jgi:hypothetical protein
MPLRFRWLLDERDRARLEAAGWLEVYRHAIYGTPLMVMDEGVEPAGERAECGCHFVELNYGRGHAIKRVPRCRAPARFPEALLTQLHPRPPLADQLSFQSRHANIFARSG